MNVKQISKTKEIMKKLLNWVKHNEKNEPGWVEQEVGCGISFKDVQEAAKELEIE